MVQPGVEQRDVVTLGPPLRPLSPVRVLAYLLGDRAEVERILAEAAEMRAVKEGTRNANAVWRLLATWNRSLRYEPLPASLAVVLKMSRWQVVDASQPPKAGDAAVFGEDEAVTRLAVVAKEPAREGGSFRVVDEQGYRMCEAAEGVLYWLRPGGT